MTNWQQRYGLLAAAGPSPALRLWDLGSETLRAEMSVSTDTCVTALATPPSPGVSAETSGVGGGSAGGVGGGSGGGVGGGSVSGVGGGGGSVGGGGDVIVAGMANGMVKLYDARVGPNPTLVFHGHNDWIVSVRFTEVGQEGVCTINITCVCVFIKLHITAQSGPVILVILCHSR